MEVSIVSSNGIVSWKLSGIFPG